MTVGDLGDDGAALLLQGAINFVVFILAIDPARAGGNLFFPRVEELIQQLVDAGASRMPSQNRYRRRAQAESSPISVNTKHWRAVLNFMHDNKDHEAS